LGVAYFFGIGFFPYFPLLYYEKMAFFGVAYSWASAKNGQGVANFWGLLIEGGCLFLGWVYPGQKS
jgi:hypothetical protein